MGMPSRKVLLLGLAGAGLIAVIADKAVLSKASAGVADLGAMVQQVQKAQAIAASIDSGNPDAIQGLLDALVSESGIEPGSASPGLFGMGGFQALLEPTADNDSGSTEHDAVTSPAPRAHRLSMVMKSTTGGLAILNGSPIRAGQTVDGVTLIEVRDDGVSVREGEAVSFIALR